MMHRSSHDMIRFVQEISARLRNVVPEYQRVVLRDINSHLLPRAAEMRPCIVAFMKVHNRYCGLHEETGKPMPPPKNMPDYRHTMEEHKMIGKLATWLAELHAATQTVISGELQVAPPIDLHWQNSIWPEKIYG